MKLSANNMLVFEPQSIVFTTFDPIFFFKSKAIEPKKPSKSMTLKAFYFSGDPHGIRTHIERTGIFYSIH